MRFVLLLFFLVPWTLHAQDLPAPSTVINSDYGARNYPGYKWHWGIDYRRAMWSPINAMEDGIIAGIKNTSEGWYIRTGGTRYWTYFHIFNDSFPSVSDIWKV